MFTFFLETIHRTGFGVTIDRSSSNSLFFLSKPTEVSEIKIGSTI